MINQMELEISLLKPHFDAINWADKKAYGLWLSQCYYIVRRSTGYLGLCLFHANQYPDFQKRCVSHIGEEHGHDIRPQMISEKAGRSACSRASGNCCSLSNAVLQHCCRKPFKFLGLYLHARIFSPAFGKYVMDQVPDKKALSFLKVHTIADEDHIEEAKEQFLALPLELQKLVYLNFQRSFVTYRSMLNAIAAQSTNLEMAA